ncbi:endonuclease I [Pseudomonas cavernae]|uniref:Endonuclease I n=1 Tax=Pseudomonas cavernae TaxID=2320867 RepID=A0A385YWI2_9PSED|nr:endonuclease [Pseudomonas cavernae]AYC31275.1 endonuclease I [Pseudomonas cavernae]
MRAVAIALTCLAACAAPCAFAGGQDQLGDPKAAVTQVFWPKLYGKGGNTLYCDQPFSGEGSQFIASAVYSSKQIKSALRCLTENQCEVVNPQFPYMLADLHNLYPALSRVELARRNAQFGDVGEGVASKFSDIGCDLKATFQLIEPRDAAKGNVARAIFYMHSEYGLPIVGQLQMYQRWSELDPPDAAEKTRNDQIEMLQGNRNRFIDEPTLAAKLAQE